MQEQPSGASPRTAPARGLHTLLEGVAQAANLLTGVCFLMLIVTLFGMVITRDMFKVGLAWMDDLVRYLQVWVVYTAAIHLTMKGDHIIMDAVYTRLPATGRLWIRRFVGVLSLVFCAIVGYLAVEQSLQIIRVGERSTSGTFPAIIGYASVPVGFILMALASLYFLIYQAPHDSYGSAGVS